MIGLQIEAEEIRAIAREFEASERQVGMAVGRALRRTAGTMRRRAQAALAKGLDVRRANVLRKRLRDLKLGRKGALQEIGVWVGLNDLPIRSLKGSPVQTASGVSFRGQDYTGAFIRRGKSGAPTVFKRRGDGRFPLVEQTFPIKDEADVILEDEVFTDMADVFMRNFRADLRARTVFGVGQQ